MTSVRQKLLQNQISVLIVEDHPLVATSIANTISTLAPSLGFAIKTIVAHSLEQAKKLLTRNRDIALIVSDLNLPDSAGVATIRALRELTPVTPIMVFSAEDDSQTRQRITDAGASNMLSKSALTIQLLNVVQLYLQQHREKMSAFGATRPITNNSVFSKSSPIDQLTKRQQHVLQELSAGYRNKEIARRLNINEQTVRSHMVDIFQIMGVSNRTQAAALYAKWQRDL
jgi:DNA-binding NarL/FixJ family response regulator